MVMEVGVSKYSFVFQPDAAGIDLVAGYKQRLRTALAERFPDKSKGWYHSCNSKAHVTICAFGANEEKLALAMVELQKALCYEHSQYVYFDHFAAFAGGAFYIAPTVHARSYLRDRARKVIRALDRFDLMEISDEPHISIGRRLEPEKIAVADEVLRTVDLSFMCSGVHVRRFNADLGQYEVIDFVKFGNQSKENIGQLSFKF
ncbi:2'-5' RNA ligase family protein [Sphingobacterium sp. N143]|uniref:2'-5' RNA ligase family protein n=1 Tax=Sphingobacterium sp. N143 TaxID=2746727 RepID=UPI0025771B24|nr:2'-5' RNA ligase family protein [Sphingobacterium sp. N143]MDM1296199.1 2'-5' RNA ligase family protein [Sphingobacterium sp. N143]